MAYFWEIQGVLGKRDSTLKGVKKNIIHSCDPGPKQQLEKILAWIYLLILERQRTTRTHSGDQQLAAATVRKLISQRL